ncbi:MAG: peptidoglycan DD-metalloendopeptidase family protein [Sarcina sp.]
MEKIKIFLKKHGFYVILSVCLIVLGVVAFATGGNRAEDQKKPIATNTEQTKPTENKVISDAELVDKNKKEEQKPTNNKGTSSTAVKDDSVATNAKPKAEIINPVKSGLVTRKMNLVGEIDSEGKSSVVHLGIDIEVTKGAEVLAVADGEVLEAENGPSKEGNYVKVKHDNGIIALYGNLDSKLSVKVGDKVKQGSTLGKVGNSIKQNPKSRVSKEYLLFHIEKDNEAVDPLKVFKELKVK